MNRILRNLLLIAPAICFIGCGAKPDSAKAISSNLPAASVRIQTVQSKARKPLVSIEDPTALRLEADIPQGIAAQIRRDARLAVHVDGVSGGFTGVISEIAPSADSVSRTIQVKVDLSAQPGLSSGQFARLLVPLGESNSLRVPVSAIVQRGQLEIVFTVANQHAQMRLVKTGKHNGDEVEVLSGLHPGDTVVVDGASQLTDGQPVEVK